LYGGVVWEPGNTGMGDMEPRGGKVPLLGKSRFLSTKSVLQVVKWRKGRREFVEFVADRRHFNATGGEGRSGNAIVVNKCKQDGMVAMAWRGSREKKGKGGREEGFDIRNLQGTDKADTLRGLFFRRLKVGSLILGIWDGVGGLLVQRAVWLAGREGEKAWPRRVRASEVVTRMVKEGKYPADSTKHLPRGGINPPRRPCHNEVKRERERLGGVA